MALETGRVRPKTMFVSASRITAVMLVLACPNHASAGSGGPSSSLEDIASAWLASDEARALADHGAAEARAARVRHPLINDAGIELRREQGELGSEAFSTSFLGASAELDWTGRAFAANRAGSFESQAAVLRARASLLEGACDVAGLAVAADALGQRAAAMETGQARLDELVRILEGLARSGGASVYELERARGASRQHRLALRAAQAEAGDARAALRVLSGHGSLGGLPEPAVLPSLESLEAQASEHSAVLRATQLEAESRRLGVRADGRAWAPTLELYGGLRQDEQGALEPGQGFEAGARIGLPGLDGGNRRAQEARASERRAEAELQRVDAALEARLAGLHSQGEALRHDQAQIGLATDLWPAAWDRYLAGEADLTELLDVAEQSEAEAIAGISWRSAVTTNDLDLACTAGTFAQHTLDLILESAP